MTSYLWYLTRMSIVMLISLVHYSVLHIKPNFGSNKANVFLIYNKFYEITIDLLRSLHAGVDSNGKGQGQVALSLSDTVIVVLCVTFLLLSLSDTVVVVLCVVSVLLSLSDTMVVIFLLQTLSDSGYCLVCDICVAVIVREWLLSCV